MRGNLYTGLHLAELVRVRLTEDGAARRYPYSEELASYTPNGYAYAATPTIAFEMSTDYVDSTTFEQRQQLDSTADTNGLLSTTTPVAVPASSLASHLGQSLSLRLLPGSSSSGAMPLVFGGGGGSVLAVMVVVCPSSLDVVIVSCRVRLTLQKNGTYMNLSVVDIESRNIVLFSLRGNFSGTAFNSSVLRVFYLSLSCDNLLEFTAFPSAFSTSNRYPSFSAFADCVAKTCLRQINFRVR